MQDWTDADERLFELRSKYALLLRLPGKAKLLFFCLVPVPEQPAAQSLEELSRALGHTPRTTRKWLSVLVERGHAKRDGDRYRAVFPSVEEMARPVWEYFREYREAE